MKRKFLIMILLGLCIGVVFEISGCGKPENMVKIEKGNLIYCCPMHPSVTSDKPGNCIICGMKLVKKNADTSRKAAQGAAGLVQEKNLEEVCVEHDCTMKNCTMHVKTHLKPGERVYCPVCGEVISTANSKVVEIKSQAQPLKKERKILYYRNPMNPEVTSPAPAKDSMGMDYVAVYEEGQTQVVGGGVTVTISPERQQLIGVKTETVKKINLTKTVIASGKIAYDPNLVIAQQEFIQALNNKDTLSQSLIDASRNKLKLLGMSDDEIAALENTKKAETNLYLPAKGENVWAYIAIYEYEIGLVKQGSSVEIEAVAYPGEVFQGKVVSINPVLDSATRTNQVRIEVLNPDDKLKPEMFVSAKIHVDMGEKLAVPEGAILDTGLRKIAYLSEEGDVLESREVTLGQKADGYYEVLSGLKEGDVVVTSGNFLVDSEAKLKNPAKE